MILVSILILSILLIWFYLAIYYSGRKEIYSKYSIPWLAILFLFIFRTYPYKILHPEVLTTGDTTPLRALARLIIYGLVFVVLRFWFRGFSSSLIYLFKDTALKLLITYVLISSSWSETPLTSLQAGLTCLGIAWTASHVARKFSWPEICFVLRWVLAIVGGLSLLALNLNFGYQGGIAETTKSLSALMSLSIVLWLWNALTTKKFYIVVLSIGISLLSTLALIEGASVAAIFTTFLLVSALVGMHLINYLSSKVAPIFIWLYLVITISFAVVIQSQAGEILASFGREAHLTGRGYIWPKVLDVISHRLWFGYGFGGFWQGWRGENDPSLVLRIEFVDLSNSHNAFLEVLLHLGLVGLCLYLLSLFKGLYLSLNYFNEHPSSKYSYIPILLLLHLVLSNIGESWPLGYIGPHYFWFMFVLVQTHLNIDRRALDIPITESNLQDSINPYLAKNV